MTKQLAGQDVARRIEQEFPEMAVTWSETGVSVQPEDLLRTARLLFEAPELDFAFLNSITAVDYVEFFELIYHLRSMRRNQSVVLKTRVYGRDRPEVESVTSLWRGANLQEREIWDLMGVGFEGHPNMKRILLWEEFPGHPLRRDYTC